jgi:uncharacterized RDD family membrane protein YckC
MLSGVTTPAGWYDDPQDPAQQRYWDGAAWSGHLRPRQQPQQAQPTAQHGQTYQGASAYQGPSPYQGGYGFQAHGQGQGQPGAYQPYPQQGGGYGYPAGYGQMVPATPDGVPLSGWWKRVAARILDGLIVTIVALPLSGYFLYHFFEVVVDFERRVIDDAAAGRPQTIDTLPAEAYKWAIPAVLISLVVGFVYEYLFLTRKGATPGKMALGISVRLRDVPGPPPGTAVLKRWGFVSALALAGQIPLAGGLFGLLSLLNYLWPLWDSRKQALHDKVAATNVVVGPQHRR